MMTRTLEDPMAELAARAGAGEPAAAAELVAQFYARIYAFLRRLCGQDADAEDLTQKTFAKVWAALPGYGGRSSLNTWLHGIAHHVYADWRRQRRLPEVQTEDWWEQCPAGEPSPFEDAAQRDEAGRLYRWVEELPAEARELVHLHYYQELTLQECAEVLDVAVGTVKYRLRGAVDQLQARARAPRPQPLPPIHQTKPQTI